METESVSETGGVKNVKPARFDLIPVLPLWLLAELYGKGVDKYDVRNWEKGYEWSKSFAAMQRHAWQFWNGEFADRELNVPHLTCVAWHAFALLQFCLEHENFDDRPHVFKQNLNESKDFNSGDSGDGDGDLDYADIGS
jgi:hypothetical protein